MQNKSTIAEDYSRLDNLSVGSERAFGIVFVLVFALISVWPLVFGDGGLRTWALVIAFAFAAVTFVKPALLKPLNLLWFRFGLLLHKIVNPVVMGIMFYGVITPMAAIMRMMHKELLRLKFDKDATSYWIQRSPPGPKPESMRDQF